MKNKYRGFIDADGGFIIIILFTVAICGGLIAFAFHSRTVEHRNIDAAPIIVVEGQRFHLYKNHLHPIIRVEGEDKTIYENISYEQITN